MTAAFDRVTSRLVHIGQAEPSEAEVAAVTHRVQQRPRRRRFSIQRPLRLAVVATSLLAATAGAGALKVLPRGEQVGKHEPALTSPSYIVATGSTAASGNWRLVYTQSSEGACIGLQILDDATATESAPLAESCGGGQAAVLSDAKESFVFGAVPEGTSRVSVRTDENRVTRGSVFDGPAEVDQDFYVAAVPSHVDQAELAVVE